MMKTIDIIVKKDGTIEIDMNNFKGKSCDDVSKKLMEAFANIKNVEEEKKPEWYDDVEEVNNIDLS